jgi:hypothetical protein
MRPLRNQARTPAGLDRARVGGGDDGKVRLAARREHVDPPPVTASPEPAGAEAGAAPPAAFARVLERAFRNARVHAALADAQSVRTRAEPREPVHGRADHVSRRSLGTRPRSRCSSAPPGHTPARARPRTPSSRASPSAYSACCARCAAPRAPRRSRSARRRAWFACALGSPGTALHADAALGAPVRPSPLGACVPLRAPDLAAAPAHDLRVSAHAADLDAMALARAVKPASRPHDLSALFDKPAPTPVLAPACGRCRAHRPRGLTLPAPNAPSPAPAPAPGDDADGVGERAPSASVERWVRIARADVGCSTHSSCHLLRYSR